MCAAPLIPPISAASPRPSDRPLIGIDVGGTKCAVSHWHEGRVQERGRFPTEDFARTFSALGDVIEELAGGREPDIGVSCGGPLDAAEGIVLDPPNLPASWHGVPLVRLLTERFGGRAVLMNDANACALAEWRFGAGRGSLHMLFLTSGTGLGAGLILNGRLYEGATGDAGEVGHLRLAPGGPVGYGKAGSAEGFCSGGGIARLASLRAGELGARAPVWLADAAPLTTKRLAEEARAGDAFATDVFREAGERLGETIAVLVDLLNPERVVIGGFYPRCRELLDPALRAALGREALPRPLRRCEIVPGELGETIGSHGAIAAALHAWERETISVLQP